ncbi:MAG: hypothetical protein V1743_02725 [Nanoarchaeota archaeon]
MGLPIICIYKKGCTVSESLTLLTDTFVEYSNSQELVEGLERVVGDCR